MSTNAARSMGPPDLLDDDYEDKSYLLPGSGFPRIEFLEKLKRLASMLRKKKRIVINDHDMQSAGAFKRHNLLTEEDHTLLQIAFNQKKMHNPREEEVRPLHRWDNPSRSHRKNLTESKQDRSRQPRSRYHSRLTAYRKGRLARQKEKAANYLY